jgi:hypothetical protein
VVKFEIIELVFQPMDLLKYAAILGLRQLDSFMT